MIRKILIPMYESAATENAVKNGIELAQATGAAVVGLALTEREPLEMCVGLMVSGVESLQHYNDQGRELVERTLAPIAQAAKAAGVEYHGSSVRNGAAANAIIRAAEEECCDLICLAMHERHDLLGTHLDRDTTWILTHSHIPVLLCH